MRSWVHRRLSATDIPLMPKVNVREPTSVHAKALAQFVGAQDWAAWTVTMKATVISSTMPVVI